MFAKLVQADIGPDHVTDAAHAVETELIPHFVTLPGACQGYWMVDRRTGHVLVMTGWSDGAALRARRRARTGQNERSWRSRSGCGSGRCTRCASSPRTNPASSGPRAHWVRATWVEGVPAERLSDLPAMHAAVVPEQSQSQGFCGSYWLADHETGDGLALSLWDRSENLEAGEPNSRRRRGVRSRTSSAAVSLRSTSTRRSESSSIPRPTWATNRASTEVSATARAAVDRRGPLTGSATPGP